MRIRSSAAVAMLGLIAASRVPQPEPVPVASTALVADYVEARTASVFAGACHYNGERITSGRQAVFAIKFSAGSWNGVDLSGVAAAGETSCDDNLAEASADRATVIVVDKSASRAQAVAVVDFLKSKNGENLGSVTTGPRSTVEFKHDADGYRVDAKGFADLTVHPMPGNACCSQPHLVWYSPLVGLEHRKVGFTDVAEYTANASEGWQRMGENSAFFGTVAVTGKN